MLRGLLGGYARGRRQTSAATLYLDFLAGLNDSRITYSGGANGTRVNSAGVIVAATTPRFDYNPVTLAARGLLVEEARTNLVVRSAEFDNASWTKFSSTVTANATTSPDGTTTADKLVEAVALLDHGFLQATGAITAGATITASAYVKAAERNAGWLQVNNGAFTTGFRLVFATLDTTPTLQNVSFGTGTIASSSITNAGNGWYRVVVTGTIDGVTTAPTMMSLVADAAGGSPYLGNGTSGIYYWGAQLEAGSFATSYIPTTTAAVTRTADSAVMTGADFSSWYNQSEGTFVVSGDLAFPANGANQFLAYASDNSYNNLVAVNDGNTGFGAIVTAAGGVFDGVAGVSNAFTANIPFKIAAAYAANNLAVCVDAQTVATDGAATIPTVLTRLAIGSDHAGANHVGSGHIQTIQYFPRRVSNEQLQAMTA